MRIFIAGCPARAEELNCALEVGMRSFLFSYLHDAEALLNLLEARKPRFPGIMTFVDSGAFSVLMKGLKLDIQSYIKWLYDNQYRIDVYANADDITSPEKSLENQRIIEREGLKPLPVYHLSEPIKYLNLYAENYDFIAIGGYAGSSDYRAMSRDFTLMVRKARHIRPDIKIHGFGIGSLPTIFASPFYSVDSTKWLAHSKSGHVDVWIPETQRIFSIAISDQSPSRRNMNHFDNLPQVEQKDLLSKIEAQLELPVSLDQLHTDRYLRTRINMKIWKLVEKEHDRLWPASRTTQTESRLF